MYKRNMTFYISNEPCFIRLNRVSYPGSVYIIYGYTKELSIDPIAQILAKVRKLVEHFKKSTKDTYEL
jgi:hypothetical protein